MQTPFEKLEKHDCRRCSARTINIEDAEKVLRQEIAHVIEEMAEAHYSDYEIFKKTLDRLRAEYGITK